ncbi:4-hydroxy-tetrahydrodipicolinate synthase [Motiliproteus sp.]|uniref:4-hydroxy-tetrahydrodipicolinate synthase n=1 Tax=Motiliproteus sp. TaxID=1898955 RepID=UPI003BAC2AD8
MIKGSLVALVTPMETSGEVDWEGLDKLIDLHINSGTHGIVAVGTTGESATLDCDEHCKVIKHVVDRVAGRIAVIAGTGANATTEAIELTRAAKEAGADACLLVTPYYNKPTQEGLYQHFKAIAEAVDVDQILYNVPGRTACDMLPETVLRLAEIPNIIGIKEATGDLDRAKQLAEQLPADFALYSGDDATALELILLGGHGDISVTANVAPAAMAQMCELALNGEAEQARAINRRIDHLHRDLFVEANPIPVKWALHEMGLIQEGIRLPLTPLSEKYRGFIRESLKAAELV